jgi:hypothetical protein
LEFIMKVLCPDEECLVDYLEGLLAEEKCRLLERHLDACEKCAESVTIVHHLVHGQMPMLREVPARVTDAAVALFDKHIGAQQQGSLMEDFKQSSKILGAKVCDGLGIRPLGIWEFSPIRSSRAETLKGFASLRVPLKHVTVDLEIEKTDPGMANIRIHVCSENNDLAVRISLKQGNREIASYSSGDTPVLFEDIPFGRYAIVLTEGGTDLGMYTFEIKESCCG